jgi:type IV fimbrial biogenesis protein FimT
MLDTNHPQDNVLTAYSSQLLAVSPPPGAGRYGMRRQLGFTLMELMVTISIVAIMATIAVPSFIEMIRNGRMASQTNDLVLALTYAKSEAVKRNALVKVLKIADATTTCGGGGSNTGWSNGWTVFIDSDDDNFIDNTEETLRVWPALEGTTLCFNAGASVEFRNTGGLKSGSGTFRLCDSRGAIEARGVTISMLVGRIRRTTDSNSDSIEEDGSGNNLTCP